MRKTRFFLRKTVPFLFVLTALTACLKNDEQVDPAARAQENENLIKEYATKQNLPVQRTNDGLYYVVTSRGNSTRKAQIGEQVTFTYTLSRLDGVQIDTAYRTRPKALPIGAQLEVGGLEVGLTLLSEGDKAVFLVPYFLGYGNLNFDVLPPYSAIRYDVQLLKIRNEEEQIDDYIAAKKLGTAEKTTSGLRFVRTQVGTGSVPEAAQTVQVTYTGTLLNDVQFDSGTFEFTLGKNAVVKGFEEGISRMRVGEKAVLLFPSSVAYGKDGVYDRARNLYTIPPYSALKFEVELKAVR